MELYIFAANYYAAFYGRVSSHTWEWCLAVLYHCDWVCYVCILHTRTFQIFCVFLHRLIEKPRIWCSRDSFSYAPFCLWLLGCIPSRKRSIPGPLSRWPTTTIKSFHACRSCPGEGIVSCGSCGIPGTERRQCDGCGSLSYPSVCGERFISPTLLTLLH